MPKTDVDNLSLDLIRKSLAIITLEDIKEKDQDENERKEYCAAIAAVFPRLRKDIEKALYQQLIKTSLQSESWEQLLVGRGVYAGMEILLETWKNATTEHLNQAKTKEEFDKHSIVGEI